MTGYRFQKTFARSWGIGVGTILGLGDKYVANILVQGQKFLLPGEFDSPWQAEEAIRNFKLPESDHPQDLLKAYKGSGEFWLVPDNPSGWMLLQIKGSATNDTGLRFGTKAEALQAIGSEPVLIHSVGKDKP